MPVNAFAAAAALVLAPATVLATVESVRPPPTSDPLRQTSAALTPSAETRAAALPRSRSLVTADRVQAPATATGRSPQAGRWWWPLSPRPAVLRPFVVGPHRWSAGHRGIDLDARVGAYILAPAAGVVTFASRVVSRPVVVVTHADGLRTAYEPAFATVPFGTTVSRGQVIGRVSAAPGHCAPRTCLHWSARRGDRYVDPLGLLSVPRIVLLPVPRAGP
jgi:murein DD-endopeptidase MepM/ murein hydrolase activator NlpD